MVKRKILVIDDDAVQAAALAKKLSETIPSSELMCASSEESIGDTVENKFYNLAILDIRMDNFDFDGIQIAKRILEVNPFARIIFVSRYLPEYMDSSLRCSRTGMCSAFPTRKPITTLGAKNLRG